MSTGDFAVQLPPGCIDVRNQPELMETPMWQCDGRGGCSTQKLYAKRAVESLKEKRAKKRQVAVDDIRTVETQAGGLSVVRAAAEIRRQG
jgi:hypothetical protein